MKPTKEQIREYYTQALGRCLEAYSRLDDKDWSKKASDRWTAKDYLAHLVVSQEDEANLLARQALAGEPGHVPGYEHREQINDYNERMLETVRRLSTSELLARMTAAFEEHLSLLDGLSESDLDK